MERLAAMDGAAPEVLGALEVRLRILYLTGKRKKNGNNINKEKIFYLKSIIIFYFNLFINIFLSYFIFLNKIFFFSIFNIEEIFINRIAKKT